MLAEATPNFHPQIPASLLVARAQFHLQQPAFLAVPDGSEDRLDQNPGLASPVLYRLDPIEGDQHIEVC